MKCPVDSIDLIMSERSGVEIDYCPKCRGVWLDRGELDKPETTQPILDGGFDQQQIAIGVEYRFDPKPRHDVPAW